MTLNIHIKYGLHKTIINEKLSNLVKLTEFLAKPSRHLCKAPGIDFNLNIHVVI